MLMSLVRRTGLQYQFELLREDVRVEQYDEALVAAAYCSRVVSFLSVGRRVRAPFH